MRDLLDKYGNPVHPCPSATNLFLARLWNAEFEAEPSRRNHREALYGYGRVLEDGCDDCRQEAQGGGIGPEYIT